MQFLFFIPYISNSANIDLAGSSYSGNFKDGGKDGDGRTVMVYGSGQSEEYEGLYSSNIKTTGSFRSNGHEYTGIA